MNAHFQFKADGTQGYYRSSKGYSNLRVLCQGSQMSRKLHHFHFFIFFFYT